jgi:hypothetical protein
VWIVAAGLRTIFWEAVMSQLATLPATLPCPTVADAIDHTLEWLDRQGCAEPETERRQDRRSRYRVVAKIGYRPAMELRENTFEVTTRNLSRTGLSFVHKTLLYPRQSVIVQLPLPDHSVRHLKAKVVRVRTAGAGLYEVGVEFTDLTVAVKIKN